MTRHDEIFGDVRELRRLLLATALTRFHIRAADEREEIVQEVFAKLWGVRHRVSPNGNPWSFAQTTLRNVIFTRARKWRKETAGREHVKTAYLNASTDPVGTSAIEIAQSLACIKNPRERLNVILAVNGWEGADRAKMLGWASGKAADARLSRSRRQMREASDDMVH